MSAQRILSVIGVFALNLAALGQVGATITTPSGFENIVRYLRGPAIAEYKQMKFPGPARIWATASPDFGAAFRDFAVGIDRKLILTLQEGQNPEKVCQTIIQVIGPSNILAIEFWNEFDTKDHSVSRYMSARDALHDLRVAVRSHSELDAVKVWGPALAPGSALSPEEMDAAIAMGAEAEEGNVHDYSTAKTDSGAIAHNQFIGNVIVATARRVYEGKKINVTEWGRRTPDDGDSESSDEADLSGHLAKQIATLRARWGNDVPLLIYSLQDKEPLSTHQNRYGLFNINGELKSALSDLIPVLSHEVKTEVSATIKKASPLCQSPKPNPRRKRK